MYMYIGEAMSIEALAMAGIDYTECNIKLEEWEKKVGFENPAPHLLADQSFSIEVEKMGADVLVAHGEWMKARMREWAKAVAATNEPLLHTLNEICIR
jgi:hypothetical protein